MRKGSYDAWRVREEDFPRSGAMPEQLRFLIRYAILAPSAHNTQPWTFRVDEKGLTVFPDFSRALAVSDPTHRELYLSLGCALAHLLIAAEHFRFAVTAEEFPSDEQPAVARLRMVPGANASSAAPALFRAIPRRRTNRAPYDDRPVSPEVMNHLRAQATDPSVRCDTVIDKPRIAQLADLTAKATRETLGRADFRAELAQWVRNNFTKRPDGMPGFAVGVPDAPSLLAPVMVRFPMMAKAEEVKARTLVHATPLVAVFSTPNDAPRDWVRAGVALERVWLQAVASGLSAAPYAGPFEAGDLHRDVERLLGITNMRAQSLLRIGYSPHDAHPAPRRSVPDVCSP